MSGDVSRRWGEPLGIDPPDEHITDSRADDPGTFASPVEELAEEEIDVNASVPMSQIDPWMAFASDVGDIVKRCGGFCRESYAEFSSLVLARWGDELQRNNAFGTMRSWDECNVLYKDIHGTSLWSAVCARYRDGRRDPRDCSSPFLDILARAQHVWRDAVLAWEEANDR